MTTSTWPTDFSTDQTTVAGDGTAQNPLHVVGGSSVVTTDGTTIGGNGTPASAQTVRSPDPYAPVAYAPGYAADPSFAGEFVRGAACQGCVYASRCYGLRRGYMDLYGDGELRTVTREER